MLNGLAGRERTIVSHARIATMTRPHHWGLYSHTVGKNAYYGPGWGEPGDDGRVLTTPAAFFYIGVTSALLWTEPDYDFVFAYLTNQWGGESREAYMALTTVLSAIILASQVTGRLSTRRTLASPDGPSLNGETEGKELLCGPDIGTDVFGDIACVYRTTKEAQVGDQLIRHPTIYRCTARQLPD